MKKRILSITVILCMIIGLMPVIALAGGANSGGGSGGGQAAPPTYKEYTITQHTIAHIQSVFDGVAEVTENGDTITVKLTSNIYGYIMLGGNAGKVILDLNGKTIDPGKNNEAICLEHYKNVVLTITGEGTIKKGANNVIYVGYNNALYFAPAKGMHYFTLKQGTKNIFSEENTERKWIGTIGKDDNLVMTQGVYTSTYTIVFDANGGEGTMDPQSAPVGHSATLDPNTFTKEGKSFGGWALSPDGEKKYLDKASVPGLANEGETVTLYAVWEKENKNYEIYTDVLADVQSTFEEIADVTKDETSKVVTIKLTSDVYGRLDFNNNSGKFIIDLNGKTIDPVSRSEAISLGSDFGGEITFAGNGTIKKGANYAIYRSRGKYSFVIADGYDYFTLKAGSSTIFNTRNYETKTRTGSISSGNLVMTQCINYYYTIKFDANGGEGTMEPQSGIVGYATPLNPNTFTKEGKSFKGWALSPDGAKNCSDKASVTDLVKEGEIVTLYALWEIPNKDYEIFEDNLADVQTALAEIAEVTKDETTGVITIKLTSDVYGRLHFNNNSGKFILDLNGKTIDPVSRDEAICLNHTFSGEITITGSGTIKKGNNNLIYRSKATIYFAVADGYDYFTLKAGTKDFFNDTKNCETKKYTSSIKTSELVITQCNLAYYTVTFDANGYGTAPDAIENIENDTKISAPAVPTTKGYVFGGWYKEPTCENAWDFNKDIVTADTTLYARWTEAPHGIYGDVTGDGKVNDFDWMTVLNHTTGEIETADLNDMATAAFIAADITKDGKLDDFDWMTILNHTTGESEDELIETEF